MELLWDGKYHADGRRAEPSRTAYPLRTTKLFAGSDPDTGWHNRLVLGDNQFVLPSLLPEFAGKINLVYIDPPFATGFAFSRAGRRNGRCEQTEQRAFRDNWGQDLDRYLQWLSHQLILIRELMHERGSLYIHLDWRAVAYVRAAADEVFGATFRNCLIWAYGGRGAKSGAGQFPRNHDQILVYSRGSHFTYHPATRQKRTPVSKMAAAGYQFDDSGRPFKTAPRGDYTDESLERLRTEDRIARTRSGGIRVKYFVRREGDEIVEDQVLGDVWTDIPDAMHLSHLEKTGYPTQKPERLLERILACSTEPGDLVLDCFCGSGATAAAAEKMAGEDGTPAPRRWIACDTGEISIQTTTARILAIPNRRSFIVQDLDAAERSAWASGLEASPVVPTSAGAVPCSSAGPGELPKRCIVRNYGAEWIGRSPMDGVRDGRLVHVAPSDRPIDASEISIIAAAARQAELLGTAPRGLDILAWEFGAGEILTDHGQSPGFPVRLLKIPRDVMDWRPGRHRAGFLELPSVRLLAEQERQKVTISLVRSPNPLGTSAAGPDLPEDAGWLDWWGIDWDHDGTLFRCGWHSRRQRTPRGFLPPDLAACHVYSQPGLYRVTAKIVDVRAVESTASVTVKVE